MPKPLPDELYHYTSIHGLMGIIENQTLWATHYKYLNDAEEISQFKERLPGILRPVFSHTFKALSPQEKQLLIDEYQSTDNALEEESKKLANLMYAVTFGGTEGEPMFAEPYISSFCTVDEKDDGIANHGLLSQWRGYGAQGGYAVIFDAKELDQLLQEEVKKWSYSAAFLGDVVYSSATDEDMRDEFCTHIDDIQNNWEKALRTLNPEALENTYKASLACACRYKHWGFAEEREFRMVVSPTSREIIETAKGAGKTTLPEKPISSFLRDGTAVPYLNLFDGITDSLGKRLPIKRIIVGPHPEKEKRTIHVERLLSHKNIVAEVSVSAIPYLGR
jgi:hypothetical protein